MIQVASAKAGLSITASGTAAAAYASLCYTVTIARRRFAAALLPRLFGPRNNVPGHTTRAPPVGFEPGSSLSSMPLPTWTRHPYFLDLDAR